MSQIKLSQKISAMARESGKALRFILNKVDSTCANEITSKIGKEQIIEVIPFSKSVQSKGLVVKNSTPSHSILPTSPVLCFMLYKGI